MVIAYRLFCGVDDGGVVSFYKMVSDFAILPQNHYFLEPNLCCEVLLCANKFAKIML